MARNGSGIFSFPAGTRGVANSVIESAKYNAMLGEAETALTESINKDGTLAFAANQSMGGHKLTNLDDGSAAAHAANVGQVQSGIVSQATTVGGTVNAITLNFSPAITAYTTGMRICWVSGGENTGTTPTIAIDGLAAKNVRKQHDVTVSEGDLGPSGYICEARYNGTRFILLNPYSARALGSFTPTIDFSTAGNLSVSYATQTGAYSRVGNVVFCTIYMVFTPTYTTASGAILVKDLPITAAASPATPLNYMGAVLMSGWNAGNDDHQIAIAVSPGTKQARIRLGGAVGTGTKMSLDTVDASDMASGAAVTLYASVAYLVD